MIKIFKCGFCKEKTAMTRQGLRQHLRYHIKNNYFNDGSDRNGKKEKKHWVIEEEFV